MEEEKSRHFEGIKISNTIYYSVRLACNHEERRERSHVLQRFYFRFILTSLLTKTLTSENSMNSDCSTLKNSTTVSLVDVQNTASWLHCI